MTSRQPALLDVRRPSRCGTSCRAPGPSHAHCAAAGCHRTLASIADFARHRRAGRCLHPASLGLVERAGLWATPERHVNDAAHAARLAEGRAARRAPTPDATERPAGTSAHPRPAQTESEPLEDAHAARLCSPKGGIDE